MLSILIPVYNQDVRKLVYSLANQCTKLKINFQILCFDDGSAENYKVKNRELGSKMNINYTEMKENLGRSKIRNWLGKAAYFDYLLFLDGDSGVRDKHFIKKYLDNLPCQGVIYGGRSYQIKKPARYKKVLHWKYGRTREALPANKRKKNPYLNFQSNNFLVPASVFEKIQFLENVEGYGYEDLQYAALLEKQGIPVFHIDNPVFHDGLEDNKVYLEKSRKAIKNLVILEHKGQLPETRLMHFQEKLRKYGMDNLLFNIVQKNLNRIEQNLMSANPSVLYFNLWKWNLYVQHKKSLTGR